jgi:hypothetical protein
VAVAEHLMRRRYPAIHNFTCWHNAAIATMGRVTGREEFVRFAHDGDTGQREQLRRGMLGDGLWFEGSMSYHFYSVWALLVSQLVFRHDAAMDLTREPGLAQSLRAPIACAYPDGTLPATNDCWYFTSILGECCHGVPSAPDFYELGYAFFHDPAFAGVLHRAYRMTPRDSVHALLLGADDVPPVAPTPRASVSLGDSGLSILRPSPEIDVMLKHGPHGGHHGHPDKLSLTGWAFGWRFSPDLGTPGYGVASLETWYRQTLSHNTVLIDGESQPAAHGNLEYFDASTMEASVQWDGVKLRRRVHARADFFIDVCDVWCDSTRTIDWVYHNAGIMDCSEPTHAHPSPAGGLAYQHLTHTRKVATETNISAQWKDGAFGLRLWLKSVPHEEIFLGRSPANPPSESLGYILRRVRGTQVRWMAVFSPHRGSCLIQGVSFADGDGVALRIAGRAEAWLPPQFSFHG